MSIQQCEAMNYFNQHAAEWARKSNNNDPNVVNVVKQRNDVVLTVIKERAKTEMVLDVGCGTGELVCELSLNGINAIGIDFAEEMIRIAKNKMRELRCEERAKFVCSSVFDFLNETDKYDLISANGFIEYISYEELDNFLRMSMKVLRAGGSLVLGSRNRLFNLFSLNQFTEEEIQNNHIAFLLSEAIKIVNSKNISDLINIETAPLQKAGTQHVKTAIDINTRYQFTPAQLINVSKKAGFEPIEIFAIHIHGVPPEFKKKNAAIHSHISNFLQTCARNNISLIPQSSAFEIHFKKI